MSYSGIGCREEMYYTNSQDSYTYSNFSFDLININVGVVFAFIVVYMHTR